MNALITGPSSVDRNATTGFKLRDAIVVLLEKANLKYTPVRFGCHNYFDFYINIMMLFFGVGQNYSFPITYE